MSLQNCKHPRLSLLTASLIAATSQTGVPLKLLLVTLQIAERLSFSFKRAQGSFLHWKPLLQILPFSSMPLRFPPQKFLCLGFGWHGCFDGHQRVCPVCSAVVAWVLPLTCWDIQGNLKEGEILKAERSVSPICFFHLCDGWRGPCCCLCLRWRRGRLPCLSQPPVWENRRDVYPVLLKPWLWLRVTPVPSLGPATLAFTSAA